MRADTPFFREDAGESASVEGIKSTNPGPNSKPDQTPVSAKVGSSSRRILIVQGDWEAGMSLLALDLKDVGHHVAKVVFCAPDLIYRLRGITTHLYRQPLGGFEEWLRKLVAAEGFDTFFLYNHYRPYNQIAWDLAKELGIECQVFELGLIRPNCVMVFSSRNLPIEAIPAAWQGILDGKKAPTRPETPLQLCQVSTYAKLTAFCANYLLSRITKPLFPNFVDQRKMNLWHHFKHGMIHLWRFIERDRDFEYDSLFAGELSGKYYAVPLQVHSDTQITRCSDFKSIEQFIRQVTKSFVKHAPPHTKLVFKIHPMDRGYKDYTDLIAGLNDRVAKNRLLYLDRIHLPTLLENAIGVVNINSSVGISGLIHHAPVIALGTAVYDLPELTFQDGLDNFWTKATRPKTKRVDQFVSLLLATNQGRGTLSQRCFDVPGRCRILWPKPFQDAFFGKHSSRETGGSDLP